MTQPDTADPGPPSTIVFEVNTARRVGAQLRYNGGQHLNEIRAAVRLLAGEPPPRPQPQTYGGPG